MMVVFEHEHHATDHDIYAQMLDAYGNTVGAKIPIAISSREELSPDVSASFAADDYVAVWQSETGTGQAVILRSWGSGLPLEHTPVSDVSFWESSTPAISGGDSGYLIAYEGDSIGNPTIVRHIYGRTYDPEGKANEIFMPLVLSNK
jgi:hypothetical protein